VLVADSYRLFEGLLLAILLNRDRGGALYAWFGSPRHVIVVAGAPVGLFALGAGNPDDAGAIVFLTPHELLAAWFDALGLQLLELFIAEIARGILG